MPDTVDITPHWPGVCRWLAQVATDAEGEAPDRVAITGGADTDLYAVWSGRVRKLYEGRFVDAYHYNPAGVRIRLVTAQELDELAYCTMDAAGHYTGPES
jgi:hypothetical protein